MGYKKLKQFILKNTPKKLVKIYQEPKREVCNLDLYSTLSYSQEGEDLLLKRKFEGQTNGFYVDIGAHHPRRFSNTFLFYQRGWSGINIDAMPGSMDLFKQERHRDINLELGISEREQELIYYIFNEPALNTFSENEASKKNGWLDYKVVEKKLIKTLPLKHVLEKYLDPEMEIDFMSIDVEGYDLEVLKSNDWVKFRPVFILVEDLNKISLNEVFEKSDIYRFLTLNGYQFVAKTFNTMFFKDLNSQ